MNNKEIAKIIIEKIEKIPNNKIKVSYNKDIKAYKEGVKSYAIDMLDMFEEIEEEAPIAEETFLNGSTSWHEWSWHGNGLCYDADIVRALRSEKFYKEWEASKGEIKPSRKMDWLDLQAIAAEDAWHLIRDSAIELFEETADAA